MWIPFILQAGRSPANVDSRSFLHTYTGRSIRAVSFSGQRDSVTNGRAHRFKIRSPEFRQSNRKELPEWFNRGGSVWESNPPPDPRRAGSPALKAGRITGPLAPPKRV